jgi:hypothetical protein
MPLESQSEEAAQAILLVRAGCRLFTRDVAHVGLVQTDWVTG